MLKANTDTINQNVRDADFQNLPIRIVWSTHNTIHGSIETDGQRQKR